MNERARNEVPQAHALGRIRHDQEVCFLKERDLLHGDANIFAIFKKKC